MKIKRFVELKGKYDPTDKILKVTFKRSSFEVPMKKVEETDYFKNYYDPKKPEDKSSCIYYGLEQYIYQTQSGYYDYELYDGLGNLIEDEEEFDKQVERMKKYNI